jgi:hypothetical protein
MKNRNELLDEYNALWEELLQEYGQNCMNKVGRLVNIEHDLAKTEEA